MAPAEFFRPAHRYMKKTHSSVNMLVPIISGEKSEAVSNLNILLVVV
jgi:hypothetical protein